MIDRIFVDIEEGMNIQDHMPPASKIPSFIKTTNLSKEDLVERMRSIFHQWHSGVHIGSDGNAGRTLEHLMGVPENNLSLPDFGDIELKTHMAGSNSLITLFHLEPSYPKAAVPLLIEKMGWPYKNNIHGPNEKSFRSTTKSNSFTDRGFSVSLSEKHIDFIFDIDKVQRHKKDRSGAFKTYGEWIDNVDDAIYDAFPIRWNKRTFINKCVEKLDQTLLVNCQSKDVMIDGVNTKHFIYTEAHMMKGFNECKLHSLFDSGALYIDFNARTSHNHGTSLRVKLSSVMKLFDEYEKINI